VFWSDYDNPSSSLDTNDGAEGFFRDASCPSATNCNTDAGNTVASYARYLTGAGQSDLVSRGMV
jgi:hypothetical protein